MTVIHKHARAIVGCSNNPTRVLNAAEQALMRTHIDVDVEGLAKLRESLCFVRKWIILLKQRRVVLKHKKSDRLHISAGPLY